MRAAGRWELDARWSCVLFNRKPQAARLAAGGRGARAGGGGRGRGEVVGGVVAASRRVSLRLGGTTRYAEDSEAQRGRRAARERQSGERREKQRQLHWAHRGGLGSEGLESAEAPEAGGRHWLWLYWLLALALALLAAGSREQGRGQQGPFPQIGVYAGGGSD
jgi:hypothetical protein